ncbi:MAG: homogentisate 1,2-dioxygenase domain-containing protein, partial [Pseudomonadota bacterium]
AKFTLPERGPIGANCLANARDFKTPCAAFEDLEEPHLVTVKWGGAFHRLELAWSPLDVVAWHGNYAPYQYDLRHFSPVGAIGFDHPDPSIFTVLTAPTESEGTANVDFLIFPERWMVAEHSFRPPWYHRNVMSEVMGNVMGEYDAKPDGFPPGGLSLHNCMLPHGPDEKAFDAASRGALAPKKLENTLAFMLETRLPQTLTRYAIEEAPMQDDYHACWSGLKKRFNGTPEGDWS